MSGTAHFGNLIRNLRTRRNMSQAHLAQAAEINERTVGRIEGGPMAAPETVMALCSVLGISEARANLALTLDRLEPVKVPPQEVSRDVSEEHDREFACADGTCQRQ